MMKKAGSDSTIMEYRLHLVLTSKELEETAETETREKER